MIVLIVFSNAGQEPGSKSGSLPDGAIVGIAVGCFIVGVLAGICVTVVAVQRSCLSKFSQHEEASSCKEQITVSSAYELSERSRPQVTYADVGVTQPQASPSQLTSNPVYLTTDSGDR